MTDLACLGLWINDYPLLDPCERVTVTVSTPSEPILLTWDGPNMLLHDAFDTLTSTLTQMPPAVFDQQPWHVRLMRETTQDAYEVQGILQSITVQEPKRSQRPRCQLILLPA